MIVHWGYDCLCAYKMQKWYFLCALFRLQFSVWTFLGYVWLCADKWLSDVWQWRTHFCTTLWYILIFFFLRLIFVFVRISYPSKVLIFIFGSICNNFICSLSWTNVTNSYRLFSSNYKVPNIFSSLHSLIRARNELPYGNCSNRLWSRKYRANHPAIAIHFRAFNKSFLLSIPQMKNWSTKGKAQTVATR